MHDEYGRQDSKNKMMIMEIFSIIEIYRDSLV